MRAILDTHLRRRGLALLLAMVMLGSGCGSADTREPADVMRDVVRNTETQPRRFTYDFKTPDAHYTVTGLFEDDFRYEASWYIDDTLVYEEVVSDDRLAVRVHDERALELLRRPEPSEEEIAADVAGLVDAATGEATDAPTDELTDPEAAATASDEPTDEATDAVIDEPVDDGKLDEAEVEELLLSGVWVEDSVGAPSLLPTADDRDLGADAVLDSLKVLRYVLQAMQEGFGTRIFDDESVFYRPSEDPFPHPDHDAGEVDRIDFERLWLPRRSDVNESGQQPAPNMGNLRKMVIYVDENEDIIRVNEIVDLRRRFKDLRERYDMDLPEELPDEQLELMALEQINALRVAQGEDPIELRSLSIEFEDVGDEDLRVTFPTGTTIAPLRLLASRGSETGSPPELPEETPSDAVLDPEVAPPADGDASEEATPSDGPSDASDG